MYNVYTELKLILLYMFCTIILSDYLNVNSERLYYKDLLQRVSIGSTVKEFYIKKASKN